MKTSPVSFLQVQIAAFCQHWRIEELALFGSRDMDRAELESDVIKRSAILYPI